MRGFLGKILGKASAIGSAISLKWLWAALVALATLVGIQSCRLQDAREDVGNAEARFQSALQAAVNNEQEAFDLAARLRAEVKRNELDRVAVEKANQTLERRLTEVVERNAQERAARDEIYQTDQGCADWRSAPVCPAIADRLRESSGSGGEDH